VPVWLWIIAGTLGGLILGSFLATLILRWPAGRSIASGRSACDHCHAALDPLDLIPLLSWVIQRGKCRRCGARIDPLHPAVEAASAAIGAASLALAPSPAGFALALLGWQLLMLAVLDARHYWLPHILSLILAISGLALGSIAMGALSLDASLTDRLIGGTVGGGGLWLIGTAYRLIRRRDGLGGGDAPMLAAIGLWTGWMALPFILLLASFAGLAVAALRMFAQRKEPADMASDGSSDAMRLPLGTLLALALFPALWMLSAAS
jgi:leader peptidase (prepilin peptidase) / N-methyltransferase